MKGPKKGKGATGDFAQFDIAHVLPRNLFRSQLKSDDPLKCDALWKLRDESFVSFKGPNALTVVDLRVLVALQCMAGKDGITLAKSPSDPLAQNLRKLLQVNDTIVEDEAIVVECTISAIIHCMGRSVSGGDGGTVAVVRASVGRLSAVTIYENWLGDERAFHLLSQISDGSRLLVALNPRLTEVLNNGGRHTRIELDEMRRLKSECAVLLHYRLCGHIDPKTSESPKPIGMEKLMSYVWAGPAFGSAERMRRTRLKKGLAEIRQLGWVVDKYDANMFKIGRPPKSI